VILGGLTIDLTESTGNPLVFLDNLASVGNSSFTGGIVINTGIGNDLIQIDRVGRASNFNGAVTVNTGAGNDTFTINGAAAGTTFFRPVNANLGAGNDELELANNSLVAFFAAASFSGGSGATDLNNLIISNLANLGGTFIPTLVHFHP
jgi:autotransporter family porin